MEKEPWLDTLCLRYPHDAEILGMNPSTKEINIKIGTLSLRYHSTQQQQ